jgi:Ni2+-binding GTPase involved in maturation of urease and hydrogenase
MGGIGSGKTTQLLVTRDRLAATQDVNAVYVDVSLHVRLHLITSADILAIATIQQQQLPASHPTRSCSSTRWIA